MVHELNNAPNHQHIFHNGESYIKLTDAADTFKRLSLWRTAIYDALTEWHDPPRDSETPKDALRRLIQHEIIAALDPAVSQSAADLVTTARREGMEEAAQKALIIASVLSSPSAQNALRSFADAISAAAKEDRPSEEIIREDRDAWPDRQANDPIRAAAEEGE